MEAQRTIIQLISIDFLSSVTVSFIIQTGTRARREDIKDSNLTGIVSDKPGVWLLSLCHYYTVIEVFNDDAVIKNRSIYVSLFK